MNNDAQTMIFTNPVDFSATGNVTINAAAGGLTFTDTVTLPSATLTVTGGSSSFGGGNLAVGLAGNAGSVTFSDGSTGTLGAISVDGSGSARTSGLLQIQSGTVIVGQDLPFAPALIEFDVAKFSGEFSLDTAELRGTGIVVPEPDAALRDTLAECLGHAFTPEVKDAWATLYAIIADAMQRGSEVGQAGRRATFAPSPLHAFVL